MYYDHINWPFHIFYMSFFTGAAILFWWLDRKRHSDFRYAARSLHLTHEDPPPERAAHLTENNLFFQKHPGLVHEYVGGTYRQHTVQAFNYSFKQERSAEMAQVYSCIHIQLKDSLPDLRISANDSSDAWRGDDLVFTQDDHFHKHFKLRSNQPHAIKPLLTDDVLTFIKKHQQISVEAHRQTFLFMIQQPLQPITLQAHLDRAFALATMLVANAKQERTINPTQS